jgi:hypothetical protein
VGDPKGWGYRENRSHFGAANPTPGSFRFNVVHLDGHVHDSVWQEVLAGSGGYAVYMEGSSTRYRPYGWKWKNPSSDKYGVELTPDFEGALDMN